MTTQCCFISPYLCFKQIDIFLNSVKKGIQILFKHVHIFIGRFIVYYVKTYSLREDLFNHIKHGRSCFKKMLTHKCSESVQTGLQTLDGTNI